jgi:hypothetical protein
VRARRVGAKVAVAFVALLAAAACSGGSKPAATTPTTSGPSNGPNAGPPTAAQLAEAARLVNIGDSPTPPPANVVACVARVVVQDPPMDELANDIAQIGNGDLRQNVMDAYLHCGYDYILDTYMRFAPPGLSKAQLTCIRSKFTELSLSSMSEVIVLDPDAGRTGPLVIQACAAGSKSNPLLKNGALINMGGS